jgi:3',5'-cyclic AMP phosphodiesterase CpdA
MRTLVHLSDLHFGRVDAATLEPLKSAVWSLAPHVVVISGDLTQRAKSSEFRDAQRFLEQLPLPRIVVPGNHDVPLYRIWERFLDPLGKYRRYIGRDLEPSFVDDEIAVLGVNTARSLTFKNGRINREQIESIRRRLDPLPASLTKVVVTHHPFDLPDTPQDERLVGRADAAMKVFSNCGVDLLLAGHFHTSQAGETSARHPLPGYSALVVQAGTATSTRGRGEANAFNALRIESDRVAIERHVWRPESAVYALERTERFVFEGGRWIERDRVAAVGAH